MVFSSTRGSICLETGFELCRAVSILGRRPAVPAFFVFFFCPIPVLRIHGLRIASA